MRPGSPFTLFTDGFDALVGQLRKAREAQQADQELARELRRYCEKHASAESVDHEGLTSERLKGLAEVGAFALAAPVEHGGLGLGLGRVCAVISEVARVSLSVATTIGVHNGLAFRAFALGASEAVRRRLFEDLAAGRALLAFAVSEPGAGSDLGSVSAKAVLEGETLSLSGAKAWITNAGFARYATVLTRTPGFGGPNPFTMLLVDLESPGVERGKNEDKLGLKGSSTATLYFDEVKVPTAHLLGEPGDGLKLAHASFLWGRTVLGAAALAAAEEAVSRTHVYVRERHQYRRPLFANEVVRARLSECALELFAAKACHQVSVAYDELGLAADWPTGCAKVVCSEKAWSATDRALQLWGAQGYMEPMGIARTLRDLRVARIFEGANDVLLGASTALALTYEWFPELGGFAARLSASRKPLGERVELAYRQVAATVRSIQSEQGTRFLKKELRVAMLAQALQALFVACSVLANAQAQGSEEGAGLVQLAVEDQCEAIEHTLRALEQNRDRALLEITP